LPIGITRSRASDERFAATALTRSVLLPASCGCLAETDPAAPAALRDPPGEAAGLACRGSGARTETQPASIDQMEITASLVRDLIAAQFPQWKILDVVPSEHQGNDNRTFRLGDELAVRLPSAEAYAAGVAKEDRALPLLSGGVSVALPDVVATGQPSDRFPMPWSVRRWLPGETLERASCVDREHVAEHLGGFLAELRSVPTAGGPACGRHSFFRGCHPSVYSDEVQRALDVLGETVDRKASEKIWAQAVRSAWSQDPVWFHGDLVGGNILVRNRAVSAVIDFGTCGVGDPACDLVIAWTFMDQERERFRRALGLDGDTWTRARGWALWKALVTLTDVDSPQLAVQRRALARLLVDTV
jgi:aminoglycoside phosphotransferase (APT) family kinase protein